MKAFLSIQQSYKPLYIRHKSEPQQLDNPWLRALKAITSKQLDNPSLVAADLAAQLFMSERQFFRQVKKVTGKTPNLFLREMRLVKAKELIQSGQYLLLKEIASQVGYKRVDYFSNLYEQRFKVRPRELVN